MIKRYKASLAAKIFTITFLLIFACCAATYAAIAWLVPRTYGTTLDAGLESDATALVEQLASVPPQESGRLFDEFALNHSDVLLALYDAAGNAVAPPTQGDAGFPRPPAAGTAAESADPAAYRAAHRYLFSFAGNDDVYTLQVAGSAREIDLLQDALGGVFLVLFLPLLAAAVAASLLYSRHVTQPVLRLSEASKEMTRLDFRWTYSGSRTDELGVLARNLHEMSQKLSAALQDLRDANARLRADIEREKALEQAQLDFFSAASHELKTPLTILKGQTEGMLLNVGAYRDHARYLPRSLAVIERMEGLVQELLTVSRIRSSQAALQKEDVDLSALLKQEYALFEDLIVQKDLHWNEDIAPALRVSADKTLLQKALGCVISNAVLYSPPGGSVFLHAVSADGAVHFRLENTGVHIPEDELPRLFDAFYRVEPSRSRQTGGSGLGLYIVKTILEQHGFRYRIENTENGVLFSIQF